MADLSRVDLSKHVAVYPMITTDDGCFEIRAEKVFLEPHQAYEFVNRLKKTGLQNVIEDSLQSLVQTPEGKNLLTASPSFNEFTSAIEDAEFMGFCAHPLEIGIRMMTAK
ncbi:MAG: hypothetical protein MK096_15710 [Oleiphilaceae bacterium]|nr:hypothetical protein [Oleiphilaceae bacterium]